VATRRLGPGNFDRRGLARSSFGSLFFLPILSYGWNLASEQPPLGFSHSWEVRKWYLQRDAQRSEHPIVAHQLLSV